MKQGDAILQNSLNVKSLYKMEVEVKLRQYCNIVD